MSKLNIIGTKVYLERIDYSSPDAMAGEYEIQIQQKLELLEFQNNVIKIRMSREMIMNPKTNYFFKVSAVGAFKISEESRKNFKNEEDMKEYIISRMGFLVDKVQIGSTLSLIMANITSSFGSAPLIVPPIIGDVEN